MTRSDKLLACALALVAGALRLPFLSRFPEAIADEGLWTNSTKNFLLFDDWFMDGRTHALLSPLFHLLSLVVFELLGPGLASARLVSAAAGSASVALLYLAIRRLGASTVAAISAALLLCFDQWLVVQSRQAMIESLQICLLCAASFCALGSSRASAIASGCAFGLALVSKINAAFALPPMVLAILFEPFGETVTTARNRSTRAVLFVAVALGLTATVYGTIFALEPQRMREAFAFELDGDHFESNSVPLIRQGRFGFDPLLACKSILTLFGEAPFLLVLSSLGLVLATVLRVPGLVLFGSWWLIGNAFFLAQMFQPLRYFTLVSPAFAFLAALPLVALSRAGRTPVRVRTLQCVLVGLCCSFGFAFTLANAVKNPAHRVQDVTAWMEKHARPDERVLAAGYLCTDLPQQAYAHYYLARTPEEMSASIELYGIDWVIADDREWSGDMRAWLDAHYPRSTSFSFGAVYRVTLPSGR